MRGWSTERQTHGRFQFHSIAMSRGRCGGCELGTRSLNFASGESCIELACATCCTLKACRGVRTLCLPVRRLHASCRDVSGTSARSTAPFLRTTPAGGAKNLKPTGPETSVRTTFYPRWAGYPSESGSTRTQQGRQRPSESSGSNAAAHNAGRRLAMRRLACDVD
jgi:hypothetical protein